MPYERRDSSGNAALTTLVSTVGPSDATMTILDSSGWPTGGLNGPFFGQIETEVIKFELRNGTLLTVAAGGRGWDSTLAATHNAGVTAEHVFVRTDGDEANYAVSQTVGKIAAAGQSLVGAGPNSFQIVDAGAEGTFYKFVGGVPVWDTLDSTDMSDYTTQTNTLATTVANAQIRALLVAGADISITDNGTTLTIAVPTLTERIQDVIGALVTSTTLAVVYDDSANTLTVNLDANKIGPTHIAASYLLASSQTAFPDPVNGQLHYDTDDKLLYVCSGVDWVCITPKVALDTGTGTTTSTTYTNPSGITAPQVSIVTGTKAMVRLTANITNSVADTGGAGMSFVISGATTLAASSGTNELYANAFSGGQNFTMTSECYVTGLTAGTNVFKIQVRAHTSGTASFAKPVISVVGIP